MILLNRRLLTLLDPYVVAYISIIIFSLIIRVVGLDDRAIHYDEAIHLMASFKLMQEGVYEHSAWMHGPFQIEAVSWVFKIVGDSLFSGRILYVLFGTGLVCLPLLLRIHVGKPACLIMALLLSISPTLVYMSRFGRNDIIIAFFSLLLFILAYKYAISGKSKFLFLISITLALIFSTKETSYFIVATMGAILVIVLVWITVTRKHETSKSLLNTRLWDLTLLLFGLIFPLCAALIGFFQTSMGLILVAPEGTSNTLTGALGNGNPWIHVESLFSNSALIIMPVTILSVITFSVFLKSCASILKKAFILSLLMFYILYAYICVSIGEIHNILLISVTTSVILLYFCITWSKFIKNLIGRSIFIYCSFAIALHHILICTGATLIPTFARLLFPGTPVFNEFMTLASIVTLIIITIFYSISLAVGLYRFSYKWILLLGLFTCIILVTYTTYFTNSQGFYTGIWQSLGYWMAQQEVARGNQPWYYYVVGLSIYEFLPIIFGILGIIWSLKTKHIIGGLFSLWAIASIIFFTVASEKMPWLLIYINLPLVLLSALFIGSFLNAKISISNKASEVFLLFVCSAALSLILLTVLSMEINLFFILFLISIGLVLAFFSATLIRHIEPANYKAILILPVFAVLITLTLNNTYFLNYRNDDSLKQFMTYAQGSNELANYFLGSSNNTATLQEVNHLTTIDYDIWYPMHWYARHDDINGTVEFRCFKIHGNPEWNETCVTINDITKKQTFLVSEIHHPLYQSQAISKNITGPVHNILWFPEIYRRPGENRINEPIMEQIKLDYMYFSSAIFDSSFWNSVRNYLFLRDTDQDWFHGDFYIYEQLPKH